MVPRRSVAVARKSVTYPKREDAFRDYYFKYTVYGQNSS